ncbi:hypothetical protein [Mariniblastus fucicola]|uniref:Uncharacterized protein n=1 Tax=Mariniblastus fucicola TaxID=980251 RepID=A0A5B9PAM5_9BACT|nr:hypothetical protein [Mariniblastus fucicola]QEG22012.1 hypothetical protein MFFC18_18730 [Mariniblastus fucicola]
MHEMKTKGPGTGLLIVSLIMIILLFSGDMLYGGKKEHRGRFADPWIKKVNEVFQYVGFGAIAGNAMVLFGGISLIQMRREGVCTIGAVLACVPCCTGTFISIPFGIWALISLNDRQVKRAFRNRRDGW